MSLAARRDALRERFDDALELKAGIDRRRTRLDAALRGLDHAGDHHHSPGEPTQGGSEEPVDLGGTVDALCRLRIDEQWVADRLDVSQRQLSALMDHILASSQATEC